MRLRRHNIVCFLITILIPKETQVRFITHKLWLTRHNLVPTELFCRLYNLRKKATAFGPQI